MAVNTKALFSVFTLLLAFKFSNGQYYLSTKLCGVLHSEENFAGDELRLLDRDQSINLHDDQRSASGNWSATKSISIESSCSMELCNETYFDGYCQTLNQGQHATIQLNLTEIVSASCTCTKECKCSDIFMKKTTCARAYLDGGCSNCHARYIDLNHTNELPPKQVPKFFPEDFMKKVNSLRLRKGCSLTLYKGEDSEEEDEGIIIQDEIVENFKGQIGSYECECDDTQFQPRVKPPRSESFPPLIDVPTTTDEVIKMLMSKEYENHPGLRAAHQSLRKGRSSKNAYIMLLGSTGSGKSSAINLLFDNPNVTKVGGEKSTTTDIHEFRIPVPIDELGVGNSELRVIDTPGLGDTRGLEHDAMFLATLDDYITSHEELKDRIPNVVLIFHKFHDNRFNGQGSAFVQMLRGLDTFRTRITDENYSNVIFVLSHFCSETLKNKKRPEVRLTNFKNVIEDFSQFPRPTIITVAENRPQDHELPMVNGFAKLPNNEYYPRNLFEKLDLVTVKGEDPIGNGVFRTAFRDSDDFNITSITFKLLPNKNDKVQFYLGVLSNALIGVINTEISKLLKHVWEEKVDPELKRKFPASLPYLQKALNMRNINTMDDVPKTATAILELLTAIKHDEATRILIENTLGIKPPIFPFDTIAGYSYNVFKDTYLSASPFVMGDLKQSDIGFMIPKTLTCNLEPSSKEHFHVFDDKEEYLQFRLQSLGIDGSVSQDSYTGTLKPGHNIKSISFKPDSCSISATREVRLFEFQVNDRLELTPEFQNTVRGLPPFNESDHETVDSWNKFFNDYGTHVVKSIYGGGAIEIELESDKQFDNTLAQALFDLIKFAEDMSFLIIKKRDDSGNETSNRGVFSEGVKHNLKFIGGDSAFHTTDLTKMSIENAAKLLTNWKKSLKYHPAVLTTEMRLVPLGQIAKKLGQNYSSEIERATSLLFNSSLKYVPPRRKKEDQPGLARDQTPIVAEYMQQMAENNKMIQTMLMQFKEMEMERQRKQLELEEKRLQADKEQKERDLEFKKAALEAQQTSEAEKRAWQAKMEKARREDEDARADRQAKYQAEVARLQAEAAHRTQQILVEIANRPPIVIEKGGGCLKPGTKILMADWSEKNVEDLKAGDLILDMDLNPTSVVGVNHQYLMDLKFYGYDNQSFFFTNEHMFVGPKRSGEGVESTEDVQYYVLSMASLIRNNPLMKYWDVKEMSLDEDTQLFHFNNFTRSVEPQSTKVFEDSQEYPPETLMYFLQVDSPTGTYFANGYVCKVDVPPVEIWPNTMSLLFKLMRTPEFNILSSRKYSFDTVFFINYLTSQISKTVEELLEKVDWRKVDSEVQNTSLITFEDVDMNECLEKIFNDPSTSLLALRLYARLGDVTASQLDEGKIDLARVAKMQHILYRIISNELHNYANLK